MLRDPYNYNLLEEVSFDQMLDFYAREIFSGKKDPKTKSDKGSECHYGISVHDYTAQISS